MQVLVQVIIEMLMEAMCIPAVNREPHTQLNKMERGKNKIKVDEGK